MNLHKQIRKTDMLVPPDFRKEIQEIEYRKDPLTGSTCIINKKRAERARQAQQVSTISDEVVKGTEKNCLFCPDQIWTGTSKFTANMHSEGRVTRGESVVFPNLFPFAEHHAVAIFGKDHFLNLDQFEPEAIENNLLACQEWTLSIPEKDRKAKYPIYMWNHMPPSGASIVHPHVQVLVREEPTAAQEQLLSRSEEY